MTITTVEMENIALGLLNLIKATSNQEFIFPLLKEKDRRFPGPAVSDLKKIGYFTQRKLDDNDINKPYDIETRQKHGIMVKPGKFFKHLFPEKTDSEIQTLVQKYYNIIDQEHAEKGFEIWDDIKHAYHEDNYKNESGSLGGSCMRYDSCQKYIEFYENYNIKILVLVEDGMVIGRALLWYDVYFPKLNESKIFMDRIYTHDYNDEGLFKDYAEKNGFVYKVEQSFSSKEFFIYNGNSFNDHIKIDPLENIIPDFAPYLDTLTFRNDDFVLSNIDYDGFDISLDSIIGDIGDNMSICEDCGQRFDDDNEGIYIENHGQVCERCSEDYQYCEECNQWYYHENGISIKTNEGYLHFCESCARNEVTYCEECGEYFLNEDVYETSDGFVCGDCLDNYTQCDYCEDYHPNDDVSLINDKVVCEDCREDNYTQCEECGDWIEDDKIKEHEDLPYCEDCFDNIQQTENEDAA